VKSKLQKYLEESDLSIAAYQRTIKPSVSYQTVFGAVKGKPIRRLDVAMAMSKATGGKVAVEDLA
jgi:hypothetical protein